MRSQLQGTEWIVITSNTTQERKFFDWDLGGKHEACSCFQVWLCMPRWIKSNRKFWKFGNFNLLMRRKTQWFDKSRVFHTIQLFGRHQDGRHRTPNYEDLRVSISRWNILKSIFHWHFDRRNEACTYYWQRKMCLNVEKTELLRGILWKFQTAKTLMQRMQINNSPIENFSTYEIFSNLTLIEEIKPLVLVKYEFEYREKS